MFEPHLQLPAHWAAWFALLDRWGPADVDVIGARAAGLLERGGPDLVGDPVLAALAAAERVQIEAERAFHDLDLSEARFERDAAQEEREAARTAAAEAAARATSAEHRTKEAERLRTEAERHRVEADLGAARAANDAAAWRRARDTTRWLAIGATLAAAGVGFWLRPPEGRTVLMGDQGVLGHLTVLDPSGTTLLRCDLDAPDGCPGATLPSSVLFEWAPGDPSAHGYLVRGGTVVELRPARTHGYGALRVDGPAAFVFSPDRNGLDTAKLDSLAAGEATPDLRVIRIGPEGAP